MLYSFQRDAVLAIINKLEKFNGCILADSIGIAEGETVKMFHVILVSLKRKDYDERTVSMLFRMIDNNMILVLEYENESRVAIYHGKLIQTEWKPAESFSYALQGLDLDSVWNNLIIQIGNIQMDEGNTIDEQIVADEQKAKLEKEIARLERQARNEKQPKKKFELVQLIKKLRKTESTKR